MLEVIKQNGLREAFDENKVKKAVLNASYDAGLYEERAVALSEKALERIDFYCRERTDVSSVELRKEILNLLDFEEPAVANAWRNFEEKKDDANEEQ